MIDTISIKELHVKTIIGVNDDEKEQPQDIFITVNMGVNVTKAIDSDDLLDTFDYDALSKQLTDFILSSRYELIESLAGACVRLIFEFSNLIQTIDLTVSKPNAIKNSKTTEFKIHRSR